MEAGSNGGDTVRWKGMEKSEEEVAKRLQIRVANAKRMKETGRTKINKRTTLKDSYI